MNTRPTPSAMRGSLSVTPTVPRMKPAPVSARGWSKRRPHAWQESKTLRAPMRARATTAVSEGTGGAAARGGARRAAAHDAVAADLVVLRVAEVGQQRRQLRVGLEGGARGGEARRSEPRRRSGARSSRMMTRRTFLTFLASDESGEGVGSLILVVRAQPGKRETISANGWRADNERRQRA